MTATPALKSRKVKFSKPPAINVWVVLEYLYGFLLQLNFWSQYIFIPFFSGIPLVCLWFCWHRLGFVQIFSLGILTLVGIGEIFELRQEKEPLWEQQTKRMAHELKTIDPLTSVLYEAIGPDMVVVTKIQQFAGISTLNTVQKKFKQLLCELSKDIISDVCMFLLYALLVWVIIDGLSSYWKVLWSACGFFYTVRFILDGY